MRKHREKTIGIYALINCDNGKIYIGSSEDVQVRIRSHFAALKRHDVCVVPDLQADFDKGDNIVGMLIDDVGERGRWNRHETELEYQRALNTLDREHGYNYRQKKRILHKEKKRWWER